MGQGRPWALTAQVGSSLPGHHQPGRRGWADRVPSAGCPSRVAGTSATGAHRGPPRPAFNPWRPPTTIEACIFEPITYFADGHCRFTTSIT